MMAPSVAPRKANVGSNNPALRLYKFDTDSGQVSAIQRIVQQWWNDVCHNASNTVLLL